MLSVVEKHAEVKCVILVENPLLFVISSSVMYQNEGKILLYQENIREEVLLTGVEVQGGVIVQNCCKKRYFGTLVPPGGIFLRLKIPRQDKK